MKDLRKYKNEQAKDSDSCQARTRSQRHIDEVLGRLLVKRRRVLNIRNQDVDFEHDEHLHSQKRYAPSH